MRFGKKCNFGYPTNNYLGNITCNGLCQIIMSKLFNKVKALPNKTLICCNGGYHDLSVFAS